MTSIEWLVDQLTNVDRTNYTNKRILAISKNSLQEKRINELVEQAKQMEKQQIIDAYNKSFELRDKPYSTAEKYYNETYGSKGSDGHKLDDVEKLAEIEYPIFDGDLLGIAHNQKHSRIDFINGYNQCLEDNKGKGFTLSDIQNAWGIAYMNGHFKDAEDIDKISFVDFISSLTQPKDTWDVYFDENNNLKLK